MAYNSDMKGALKNFHLPIPDTLHRRLHAAAARLKAPATAVARQAIEYWLEENERIAVHEAVAEYARSVAGTSADLDQGLEEAAVEHLLSKERKRSE
jgi:predicted DNA-binding protein